VKKLFFACAAILCLVLAYHFGAVTANGAPTVQQIVAAGGEAVLLSNGEIWSMDAGWHYVGFNSPVPASEVAFMLSRDRIIDTSGNGWTWWNGWTNRGPAPGGPTPVIQESFGALKARYR
jgi:hypothetical protein